MQNFYPSNCGAVQTNVSPGCASSTVKNQINSPTALLPLSLTRSFFYPPSSAFPDLPLLTGAHCQSPIPSGPVSLCIHAKRRRKKKKNKKQSQSWQTCVVTPLPYRHNTARCLFHRTSPNELSWLQKGGSPWKNNILTKTLSSLDKNHINISPPRPQPARTWDRKYKYNKTYTHNTQLNRAATAASQFQI